MPFLAIQIAQHAFVQLTARWTNPTNLIARPLALPARHLLDGALKDNRILDQHPLTECRAAARRLTALNKTFGTFINHFSMETYK